MMTHFIHPAWHGKGDMTIQFVIGDKYTHMNLTVNQLNLQSYTVHQLHINFHDKHTFLSLFVNNRNKLPQACEVIR